MLVLLIMILNGIWERSKATIYTELDLICNWFLRLPDDGLKVIREIYSSTLEQHLDE